MKRIKLAVAALAVSALVAAPAAQPATILVGTVGPGFTIKLTKGGVTVKKLTHGTYVIRVSDKSNIHNFHLKGPSLNKTTSVTGTGSQTWTVKLRAGTYVYVCDPHSSSMRGTFKVT